MSAVKNTSSKGPTPKKGSIRHRETGGRRTTTRAALLHRYTAPIPKDAKKSPAWYGYLILGLVLMGILTIVLNYLNVLPGGAKNWYLLVGIAFLFSGFASSMRWR